MLSSLIFLCACGGGRQLKGTYKFDGDTLKIEYEGGTHDEYFYDEKSDTLDWYGSGIVIFSKSN